METILKKTQLDEYTTLIDLQIAQNYLREPIDFSDKSSCLRLIASTIKEILHQNGVNLDGHYISRGVSEPKPIREYISNRSKVLSDNPENFARRLRLALLLSNPYQQLPVGLLDTKNTLWRMKGLLINEFKHAIFVGAYQRMKHYLNGADPLAISHLIDHIRTTVEEYGSVILLVAGIAPPKEKFYYDFATKEPKTLADTYQEITENVFIALKG